MKSLVICLFALQLIMFMQAAAEIDCKICHQGGKAVSAIDTIIPTDETCFQCHNIKYDLQWQDLDIHRVHIDKIQVLSPEDSISRHPRTDKKCYTCHQHEFNCLDCHSDKTPHTKERPDCSGCHNIMENLFKHQEVSLTKHNIFGIEPPESCGICHNIAKGVLNLASGQTLEINRSSELCRQCHSTIYKEWIKGDHWLSSPGSDVDSAANKCSYCHDVHAPEYLYWLPQDREGWSIFTIIGAIMFTGFVGLLAFLLIKKYSRSKYENK